MDKPSTSPLALDTLTQLLSAGIAPKKLDEIHDLLRLLGVVLGQVALLDVATDPNARAQARVAAARALTDLHESPEKIAERLRRSPFADLTVAQLEGIVEAVKSGQNIQVALDTFKEPDHA